MPDRPGAELLIDEQLVRHIVTDELPERAEEPLSWVADGWDCSVWRIAQDAAVRLPRRSAAAKLIRQEHHTLTRVGSAIEATGLRIPSPIHLGAPSGRFPWPWSIVAWIPGRTGTDTARTHRRNWAIPLAAALHALHTPAPLDYPRNAFRGVPLSDRDAPVRKAIAIVREDDEVKGSILETAWVAGAASAPWTHSPVWIHGDLHPGNLIAEGERLTGIIDFGDVTAGDPAYDLATAWLTFDGAGRDRFLSELGSRYGESDWTRARAWAAGFAAILWASSDDDPDYRRLADEAIHQLSIG